MRNKGFTLVELLAVIVVLAVLIGIVTTSVAKYINQSRNSAKNINLDNLKDAAISYVLDNKSVKIANSCAYDSGLKVDINNYQSINNPCKGTANYYVLVTIKDLKDKAYFDDVSSNCEETAQVLVYKQKDVDNNVNYYADILDEACKG